MNLLSLAKWILMIAALLIISIAIMISVSASDCTKLAGKNNATINFILSGDATNTYQKLYAYQITTWTKQTDPFKNYSIAVYNGSCSFNSNDIFINFQKLDGGILGEGWNHHLWLTYPDRSKLLFFHELGHAYNLPHYDNQTDRTYMASVPPLGRCYNNEQQIAIKANIHN